MINLSIALMAASVSLTAASSPTDTLAAIRQNDLVKLRLLTQSPEAANAADGLQSTPLHYAALYGSSDSIKILLKAGAHPDAKTQSGVTPLVYAAWDFERTRLLVEQGASVNVATNQGITPLLVAAAAHGNLATLRYLLDKGANVNAIAGDGEDALIRAAGFGDTDMVALLLARGADPKRADKANFTALQAATNSLHADRVRLLLRAGSDPNSFNTFAGMVKNGPIALVHLTPLMTAVPYGDQETVACLLKAGARVNETDSRKMTPLMLSIATDLAQPATVRQLLAAGADVDVKDQNGETALDWARKYQNPEILSLLEQAGASGHAVSASPALSAMPVVSNPRASIAQSFALFDKSDFFRAGGGCAGCHHQPIYARAYAAARKAQLPVDAHWRSAFLESQWAARPRLVPLLPFLSAQGGDYDSLLSPMAANADLAEPANSFTDMMVHLIAARQDPPGAWIALGISRAPIEESSITRTAYAIQALVGYGWPARQAEFGQRVEKAKLWLQQATPQTTYEHADRLLGLTLAGVPSSQLDSDAHRLLQLQREDGGWAQTKYLQSDAYATGMVLDTLFKAGLLKENDPAYQRGVSFLLRTQFPDGSWFVRSRAPKFQPYFQSGFPFNHDQWISSAGTAWAVMALSHASGALMASQ